MGTLYRKRPGGNWYASYWLFRDGRWVRIQRCTKTTSKPAARRLLSRWETTGVHPRDPEAEAPETVGDLITWFCDHPKAQVRSSHHRYKGGHVARLLGDRSVADLTTQQLEEYVDLRTTIEGAAPGSVVKELRTLGRALRFDQRYRGNWKGDVTALMPEVRGYYQPRRRWLTQEEFRRLTQRLPPSRVVWVWVACYTGGRRGTEVERLDWRDIDWDAGTVHLRGTKTPLADRVIPLAEPLRRFLWPMRKSKGLVVERWWNLGRELGRLSDELASRAKPFPRVTANDLRRTYGSWLRQAGVPDAMIAALLGHADVAMVERVYGRLSIESLAAQVAKLPDMARLTLAEHLPTGGDGRRTTEQS